jgi:hypothetical protein
MTLLSFQEYPFLVLDFDGTTADDLQRLFIEKDFWFSKKFPYSLSPSLSGKGCHLHVWVDLSMIRQDGYSNNREEAESNWQYGERYSVYKELQNWLLDEIEKEVGVKGDRNAVGSHFAFNPTEMGIINRYWADKTPVVLPFADLSKFAAQQKKTKYRISLERRLEPFFNELYDFLLDGRFEEVSEWCEDRCGMTTVNQKYYQQAMIYLRNNFSKIKEHILRNWSSAGLFALKKEDVWVGVEDVQSRFFGVENTYFLTYIRRIFLYIFNFSQVCSEKIR